MVTVVQHQTPEANNGMDRRTKRSIFGHGCYQRRGIRSIKINKSMQHSKRQDEKSAMCNNIVQYCNDKCLAICLCRDDNKKMLFFFVCPNRYPIYLFHTFLAKPGTYSTHNAVVKAASRRDETRHLRLHAAFFGATKGLTQLRHAVILPKLRKICTFPLLYKHL